MLLIPRRTWLDVVSLDPKDLISGATKHYYMLNVYAVGLVVSEKNIFVVIRIRYKSMGVCHNNQSSNPIRSKTLSCVQILIVCASKIAFISLPIN